MEGFNRLYIHAKVIIIDRKAAFIGSINFSKYSIDRNRELGIIVMDPEIIRRLEDVFNRDWDSL
jgi:phosphatidylserine/phosphatidylglycerophosphate/cardiolipin synthase-like enzyme